jgi:hypothetical protein
VLRLIQWLVAQEWLLRRLGPLLGPFNPFLGEHRRDPHATWRRLREATPVFYSRILAAWVVTRYDDVALVLRDRNFTTDRSQTRVMTVIRYLVRGDGDLEGLVERNLLMLDGAEHRRLRGLVSKAFTPRRIEELRPRVEAIVDELLDRAAEQGGIELVRDFAQPLPVVVIAELLGVPVADRDRFQEWSSELVKLLDLLQARGGDGSIRRANRELNAYFRPLLAERRARPRNDLLSAMLAAEQDGDSLSERDLLALSTLLLVAGHETTTNLIANAVLALLGNPGERKRLRDDPALIETAVDEFLRFDGPIQFTDRAAIDDCEIGGQRIRGGQLVVAVLASANRDSARFPDPDRLDVGRTPNPHMAFGLGSHFCLGAQLAKLETEVAVGALLRRFPDLAGSDQPAAWRRSMILRGPVSVPLRLVPE